MIDFVIVSHSSVRNVAFAPVMVDNVVHAVASEIISRKAVILVVRQVLLDVDQTEVLREDVEALVHLTFDTASFFVAARAEWQRLRVSFKRCEFAGDFIHERLSNLLHEHLAELELVDYAPIDVVGGEVYCLVSSPNLKLSDHVFVTVHREVVAPDSCGGDAVLILKDECCKNNLGLFDLFFQVVLNELSIFNLVSSELSGALGKVRWLWRL